MSAKRKLTMKWMAFGAALLAAAAVQVPVAQATVLVFTASLDGPSESPPNGSPGTGATTVTIDDVANTMRVEITFADLQGTTTASHIHCCTAVPGTATAPVATQTPRFVGFPQGVTSGSYDHLFDLTNSATYNIGVPNFITAHGGTVASAEAALIEGLEEGRAYLNIHTNVVPSGEIRGFLALTAVPEPSSLVLLAAAFCGMLPLLRRREPAHRA